MYFVNGCMSRKQQVTFKFGSSHKIYVLSGVPHRTMCGPVLFLILISDIYHDLSVDVICFADDTRIFRIVSSTGDSKKVQSDIHGRHNRGDI